MRRRPRLFPSDMDARERRVYGAAVVFFLLLFAALLWPVYPLFAGIRPRVLGLPLSLAYVIVCLTLSFLAQLGLFLWEGDGREGPGPDEAGTPVGTAEEPGAGGRRRR